MNSKIYRQADSRWGSLPYPTKKYSFAGNGCGCCACLHVIIELEKFNKGSDNNENGEKDNKIVRYFNYYLSNLKIIFYAMKTIMENNDIIDSIDKFGSLEYNNENYYKLNSFFTDINENKNIFNIEEFIFL